MSVDSFFTKLNPLVVAILRSPLHVLASGGLLLLTVTGRKSGRRYSIPVGYQREGEVLTVLVSDARHKNWWRNFREPAPVELRLRGRERTGRAELLVADGEAFRRSVGATLHRVPGMARVFGIRFDREAGVTDAQWKQLAGEVAAVRIVLDPSA